MKKQQLYKKNSITTSSPGQILLLLYAGALKNVRKARKAIEDENITEKCKHIIKAQDIIYELANSLDTKEGGELVGRLEGLYDYMGFQLTEAHVNNQTEPLDNVEKVLVTLNDGWSEAVKQVERG
jgi:flagellar protein FliS